MQERIEGRLNADLVKRSLDFPIDYRNVNIIEFLTTWIDNARSEDLKDFVRAVVGSNSLRSDQKMHIYTLPDLNLDRFPESHTCGRALHLPAYRTQEEFNIKMRTFLENVKNGGSGYSAR